ncbi:MAG: adenosylmethionine decarboxylase [Deferrisomatales bacterium]|nr:adenosylmethionine decarboxylase [Deferrisomatales bacterium]
MKAFGRHLLVEYRDCDRDTLDDLDGIEDAMRQAAVQADATVVASVFHPFSPQGVTGVVVVEESHLSIHTWPEHGYAAVDFYTCGDCEPQRAHDFLRDYLGARRTEVLHVDRGLPGPGRGIAVRAHETEGGDSSRGSVSLPVGLDAPSSLPRGN